MIAHARAAVAAVAAALALVPAACGSSTNATTDANRIPPPTTLNVYSSLPMQGAFAPAAQAIDDGIRLALWQHHGRAGSWRVNYIPLDDSSPAAGTFDAQRAVANAHRAAFDPAAVLYLGDFESAASGFSIPILNQAGVAQISPSNTDEDLTIDASGNGLYPSGERTYFRLMPRESVALAAGLMAMQKSQCSNIAAVYDPSSGRVPALLQAQASYAGINVVASLSLAALPAAQRAFLKTIRGRAADCLYLAAQPSAAAVTLMRQVHSLDASLRLFGADAACTTAFTSELGSAVAALYQCTLMPMKLSAYPGATRFSALWTSRYGGSVPDPYAVYGYEAMSVGLDTLSVLGPQADNRSAVVQALHAMPDRHSVLGSYSFTPDGDTTLTTYGLYGVGSNGQPVFERTLSPVVAKGL